jgi:hypothetical protein
MAVRRVLLALSRFGEHVLKVTVRLAEPANPLGGVDQRCGMRASLQAGDDIQAEAINGRIDSAIARAAAQLARRVGWALDGAASDGSRAANGAWGLAGRQPLPATAPTGPRRQPSASGHPRTRAGRTGATVVATHGTNSRKRRRV